MIRLLAAIFVFAMTAATAASPQDAPQRTNEQREGANDAQRSQPPIQITVQSPEPDPKIAQQEQANRDREIAIQERGAAVNERIASYTRILAWVTAFQLLASFLAFYAAIVAAKAAKKSADTAHDAFIESRIPYLDVDRWSGYLDHSQYFGVGPTYAVIKFSVINYGITTSVLERTELFWSFGDEPAHHEVIERNAPIGSQRDFEVIACEQPLPEEQSNLIMDDNGLVLRVWGRIHYRGLSDKESFWRTFGRFAIFRFRSKGSGDNVNYVTETTFRLFDIPGFYREGRSAMDTLPLEPPSALKVAKWESRKERGARAEQRAAERKAQKEATKNEKQP